MAGLGWHFSHRNLWVVLGILHFVSVQHVECICSPSESQALLDLKGNNQSDGFSSWRNGSDCCRGWAGVTCDKIATHVIALNLTGRLQLRGGSRNISKSVCHFSQLEVFNISFEMEDREYVEGTVPGCLWDMSAMRYVRISTVGEGEIYVYSSLPGQVCNLVNLTHLDIGGISFEGGVPPTCLWGMNQLEHLNLTSALEPEEKLVAPVCNLTNLTKLGLTCKISSMWLQYRPPIPSCIWNMTRLESLSLSSFGQPSRISMDICNLASLVYLSSSDNELQGNIPLCIWNLTRLERLTLTSDSPLASLQASISSDVCNLKCLSHLELELSYAHGYIPDCLWNMTRMEVFSVRAYKGNIQIWNVVGSFSSHMCSLSKLRVLEISSIAMSGVLPACIWSMTQLEHLDLSGSQLSNLDEPIPNEVFAPSLVTLSLASTNVSSALLEAIGNASALTKLDLSGNKITNLPAGIPRLSNLTVLYASSNQITSLPAWMWNLSSLEQLDMSDNFISDLSKSHFNLSTLYYLDLSSNHLKEISLILVRQNSFQLLYFSQNLIQKVTIRGFNVTLTALDLSNNFLRDTELSVSLLNSTIGYLDLSGNFLKSIAPSMFSVASITELVVSENPVQNLSGLCGLKSAPGDVPLSLALSLELSNLNSSSAGMSSTLASLECLAPNISYLDLSSNNISSDHIVLIARLVQHLFWLDLSNCNISGDFVILMGSLLHNQKKLFTLNLDLSNNNIHGNLSWFTFPGAAPNFSYLDVSRNQLGGELPKSLLSTSVPFGEYVYLNVSYNRLRGCVLEPNGGEWILDLSSNCFEGPLPSFSTSTFGGLFLSNNNFTGPIPAGLGRSTHLVSVDMSHNKLSGEIPAYISDFKELQLLDLSSNGFNGSLPVALGDCCNLQYLRLQNNSLHGPIPTSIGIMGLLLSLTLSQNHFEGLTPSSLGDSVLLAVLDLSHNNLSGTLPATLENLSFSLRVFSIASNRLTGVFPVWIVNANFTSLQVLDLSNNAFHGNLPNAYSNLVGFIHVTTTDGKKGTLFTDGIQISAKGLDSLEFTYFLTATTSFDVSCNNFSGPIPEKLSDLLGLRYLKLSENNFLGNIPLQLSNLSMLESLDLSRNSLTGEISSAFGQLDGLSYFNVSYNHLTGEIPTGGQFNTFNESFFVNNSGLCGFPLSPCQMYSPGVPTEAPQTSGVDSRNHVPRHVLSQWISLGGFFVGVATGFGAILVTFFVSKRARNLLYVPGRKGVIIYNKPYGAYRPRS